MIPNGAEGIAHIATRIIVDLIPKAVDDYTAADLGMLAALIGMIAQDYDRAADVLLSDIEEIKAIFTVAGRRLGDASLRERMAAELAARPEGMKIHQLNARADAVMRVLIDLQAAAELAEADGDDGAARLNRTIWTFLDNHVVRRQYDSAF